MLGNRDGTDKNEKPQVKVAASTQGSTNTKHYSNNTTLRESKSRHDKGTELYKAGRVSINSNGLFKVSGYYEVDTERMTCTCPDYKTRKEPCKHVFAACLFVKNRGKQTIKDLDGFNGNGSYKDVESAKDVSKPLDRQSTITRLAALNTATEIVKTWGKPVEFSTVISLAARLEKWALGSLDKSGENWKF